MRKYAFCMLLVLILTGLSGCGESENNKSDGALLMSQNEQSASDESEAGENDDANALDEESDMEKGDTASEEASAGTEEDEYKQKAAEELLAEGNLYILTGLDTEAEQITLRSLQNGKRLRYRYTLSTRFLNKYNEIQSESRFLPGTVVSIEKNGINELESVRMNGDVWMVEDLDNYSIDGERGIFTLGQTRYRLSDLTEIFVNDTEASLGDIRGTDVLRVIGLDKDILSISVTTGHGYLTLVNTILFDDSILSIGGKIHMRVTADTSVELTEGEYVVTAAKDGYGGSKTVLINSNEQTVLDLAELKGEGPKKCKIKFIIEAEGARVFIDHEEVAPDEEAEVAYGQHQLKIIADGYETWEKTLVVNSPTAQLELSLVKNGETDKRAASADNSASPNGQSSDEEKKADADAQPEKQTDTASDDNSSSGRSTTMAESNSQEEASSSGSTATAEERNKAEIDYLTTLSNMITTLTGN